MPCRIEVGEGDLGTDRNHQQERPEGHPLLGPDVAAARAGGGGGAVWRTGRVPCPALAGVAANSAINGINRVIPLQLNNEGEDIADRYSYRITNARGGRPATGSHAGWPRRRRARAPRGGCGHGGTRPRGRMQG